eukprot:2104070-Pyramimonas_sp.AAC.1
MGSFERSRSRMSMRRRATSPSAFARGIRMRSALLCTPPFPSRSTIRKRPDDDASFCRNASEIARESIPLPAPNS